MPAYLQKGPTISLPANKTTQTNVAFGLGNGSDVNFTVTPPTGFSSVYVSTIYRRDWQGNVALSPSARTNNCTRSEPTVAQLTAKSTGITDAAGFGPFNASIQFPADATDQYAYAYCSSIDNPTISLYVQMDDRNSPIIFDEYNRDFALVCNSAMLTQSLHKIELVSGSIYRVSASVTGIGKTNFGIRRLNGGYYGSRGFRILGYQAETGSAPSGYIRTNGAPVTVTDYTVSGLTYTLAETPVTGAILSYTGYSYTAAYATFDIPTCGSISISPSGLTSGKLQITASVDGANFNPDVILPIDEATGVLAASSDLPNGFYTLNVKPFKSIRFTQTDVTDTVTISTALGR